MTQPILLSDIIKEIEIIGDIAILEQPSPTEMGGLNRALDSLESVLTRLEDNEGPALGLG